MNLDVLILESVDKKDPYTASKKIHLENWWKSFGIKIFAKNSTRLNFFSEIFSDDECWEEMQTNHYMKLNRRLVARKMVHTHNRTGRSNPLSTVERYQIACKCCLEEDIAALFEKIKQDMAIKSNDTASLKKLIDDLNKDVCCKNLMRYWSHILMDNNGYPSVLNSEGMHKYEYGLESSTSDTCPHVEAVEFFWNKIKALPEHELSFQKKHEIFVTTTVQTVKHFDVFEFCIDQVSPSMYPEILKRDFARNGQNGCASALVIPYRFDLIKALFDSLGPEDIPKYIYGHFLKTLIWDMHSHHTNQAVELFVHIWMKEGFNRHRYYVLINKDIETLIAAPGTIVVPLVEQNYMEILWAVLDNASDVEKFKRSEEAKYIRYLLNARGDMHSLEKLSSYKNSAKVKQ